MKAKMLGILIGMMVKRMDAEAFKVLADRVLDFVEDYVAKTKTPYDDAVMLPLCLTIRAAFNIPDND